MLKSGRSVSFSVGSSFAATVMRVSAGIAASNTVPTSSTARLPGKNADGQRIMDRPRANPERSLPA